MQMRVYKHCENFAQRVCLRCLFVYVSLCAYTNIAHDAAHTHTKHTVVIYKTCLDLFVYVKCMKVFVYVSVCAYTNITHDVYKIYHIQTVNKFVYRCLQVRLHALVSLVYKFGRVRIRQMKVFVYVSVCAYTNIAYDVYKIYHCHIQTVNKFVYEVRLHALVSLVYKFGRVCIRQMKVFVYVSV